MSITVNIVRGLQKLFPGIDFLRDVVIQDDSDGRGPYIKQWYKSDPIPTTEEINAANLDLTEVDIKPTVEQQLQLIYLDMKNKTENYVTIMDKWVGK